MSSTNRSDARDTHVSDYYVTPLGCIQDMLKEFTKDFGTLDNKVILDPCAGGDENHDMSYPVVLEMMFDNVKITTLDIRETSKATFKRDYLQTTLGEDYDVIITNPPFNIAESIIAKALMDVKEGG